MKYYIVDAFTKNLFHGNQAGVCLLDKWLDDSMMQEISAENNLAETAFIVKKDELYEMDFPARPPIPVDITQLMEQPIGVPILEAHLSRDLLLLVEDEETIRTLSPNIELLKTIPDALGVVVTAKGDNSDFVSRFFAPKVDANAPEDSVTGSTHCTLIPFWAERLGKTELIAYQLSKRGGVLYCENCTDRVKISGHAALYLEGNIQIP